MPTHRLTSYFHCKRRKSEKQARPRDHRSRRRFLSLCAISDRVFRQLELNPRYMYDPRQPGGITRQIPVNEFPIASHYREGYPVL